MATGLKRMALAGGSFLAALALLTSALVTDRGEVAVRMDGSENTFDLVVAGEWGNPGWLPQASDWGEGDARPYRVALPSGAVLAPGGTVNLRVAAKNASPRIAGALTLEIRDPDPLGVARNPKTGNHLELFNQLEFTVKQESEVIYDHVSATGLGKRSVAESLAPQDFIIFDVQIGLPQNLGNEWQGATTGVEFHFEGEGL
ncbi:MAG: hypothetical protein LBR21_09255 [Propionibacteriaceae bacterium]|jgi:hypothetical protein|nr:hypothetical protein [Propionibacteriaceae bacterium]